MIRNLHWGYIDYIIKGLHVHCRPSGLPTDMRGVLVRWESRGWNNFASHETPKNSYEGVVQKNLQGKIILQKKPRTQQKPENGVVCILQRPLRILRPLQLLQRWWRRLWYQCLDDTSHEPVWGEWEALTWGIELAWCVSSSRFCDPVRTTTVGSWLLRERVHPTAQILGFF